MSDKKTVIQECVQMYSRKNRSMAICLGKRTFSSANNLFLASEG